MRHFNIFARASAIEAALPGCDGNGAGTANGPKQKKLRLAFVANTASEYWSMVNVGCAFAAKQVGDIDLEFHCPTDRTPEAQQQLLTDLIAQGLDGVAVSPIDADRQTDFLKSIASKTLLVCADSDAEKSGRACYIGSDNVVHDVSELADDIRTPLLAVLDRFQARPGA